MAGLATVAAFALFGLFTSLTPGFITRILGDRSHALAGPVTVVVFGAAALAQIALSRAAASRKLVTGQAAADRHPGRRHPRQAAPSPRDRHSRE